MRDQRESKAQQNIQSYNNHIIIIIVTATIHIIWTRHNEEMTTTMKTEKRKMIFGHRLVAVVLHAHVMS